jgi:cob(I)alamin adenosyltransferase
MGIVTKKGDSGKTSLYRGGRVSKDDIRIDTCGIIDELSSYLGLSKSMIGNKPVAAIINSIQEDLFVLSTEIVTEAKQRRQLKKRIDTSYVERLDEFLIDLEEKKGLRTKCFKIPGASPVSSVLDIGRTIARRAERSVTTMARKKILTNKYILIYLNRLSDLLFLLARLSKNCLRG